MYGAGIVFMVIGITSKNYAFVGIGVALIATGWRKKNDAQEKAPEPRDVSSDI